MNLFPRSLDRNPYIQIETQVTARNVRASLATQAINFRGLDMRYYIRSFDLSRDRILGEDTNSRFLRYFDFVATRSSDNESSNKFFTLLGIQMDLEETYFATKIALENASRDPVTREPYYPKVGDIIEVLYSSFLLEITAVPKVTDYSFFMSTSTMVEFTVKAYKDERYKPEAALENTTLGNLSDKTYDIFDNSNLIDSKKEELLYNPSPLDAPSKNPYASW